MSLAPIRYLLRFVRFRCRALARRGRPAQDRRMKHAIRAVVALLSLALTLCPPAARAAEPVDLLLVLAADVSRSVTEPKFKLQREGAAAAITHPEVVRAIASGPNRRIAVCFLEWATAGQQNVVVDWTVIADAEIGAQLRRQAGRAAAVVLRQHRDQPRHRLRRDPARARALQGGAARHRRLGRRHQQFRPSGDAPPATTPWPRASPSTAWSSSRRFPNRSAPSIRIRRAAWRSTSRTTSSAASAPSPSSPKAMNRSAGR